MYGDLANKLVLDAKRFANLPSIPMYQADLIRDIVKETNDLNKDSEYLQIAMENLQNDVNKFDEQFKQDQKINQCQTFVTHLSMRRNKRCLLAYEKLRSDKLVEFSWLNIDPYDSIDTNVPSSSVTPVSNEASGTTPSKTTTSTTTTSSSSNRTNGNPAPAANTIPSYTTQLEMTNLNHFEQDFYKNYQELIMNYKSKFGEYLDLMGDLQTPSDIFIDVRCLKDGGDVTTEYGSFNLIKDSQFYVRKSDVERLIQQGYLEEI
ncbi:PSF1 [Candida oxycetoniae]|uniref:DNA replication complex GINS protein PSF1 n=1 Tax=Candida oxycetoniae TaxID=497107 RepID=A0AAI9SX81_9ASCO|nr:PSF1 [Candida oxycetoniae]KAI3404774.2 PSF1 [Candida oxycetoniae]